MNITEVERLTGISKQSIRYYEKEGLISPKRNKANNYREYGEKEIRELKLIRVLRSTGMPVEDVRKVLTEEITLNDAINAQQKKIQQERRELTNVLHLCDELKVQKIKNVNADYYIEQIQTEKKKGNTFYQLWEDYKQVTKGEAKKVFCFEPISLITTSEEFTKELLKYAQSEKADIVITKEGMCPEFIWNGIEYSAYRSQGIWGQTVYCEMCNPDLAEAQGMDDKRKSVFKNIMRFSSTLIGILVFDIFCLSGMGLDWWQRIGLDLVCAMLLCVLWYISRKRWK